jgi:hypothetical protein
MSLLRLPCRILSLLDSYFICVVVSNVFVLYFGLYVEPYAVLDEWIPALRRSPTSYEKD